MDIAKILKQNKIAAVGVFLVLFMGVAGAFFLDINLGEERYKANVTYEHSAYFDDGQFQKHSINNITKIKAAEPRGAFLLPPPTTANYTVQATTSCEKSQNGEPVMTQVHQVNNTQEALYLFDPSFVEGSVEIRNIIPNTKCKYELDLFYHKDEDGETNIQKIDGVSHIFRHEPNN